MYAKGLNTLAIGQRSGEPQRSLLLQDAATAFQIAHQSYPKWSYALGYLAETEVALGDFTNARGHFIEAVQLDPWWSMPWHELGFIFAKEGDSDRALGCFLLGYRFCKNTEDGMFDIQMVRYGKDRKAAAIAEEAMKRITVSELTYHVSCDVSFMDSHSPSNCILEVIGVKPGLNSPLREGSQFQADKGGFKTDLRSWFETVPRDLSTGGLSSKKHQTEKARFSIDRVGRTSDFQVVKSTGSTYDDNMLLSSLHEKFHELPPGVSDIVMDLNVYLGQPLPSN